jgi:hypothetical protein
MRKVIVHIGHGKTGSSFLQSVLARNTGELEKRDIDYPYHPSMEEARRNHISSGNGLLLLDPDYPLPAGDKDLLYSSEILFLQLLEGDRLERLVSAIGQKGWDLRVLVYTRDLFDYCFSSWGQFIKRRQGTLSFNEYLLSPDFFNVYEWLRAWFGQAERFGFSLQCYNYSRRRAGLWEHFIGRVTGGEAFAPEEGRGLPPVNRSLTLAEYEIQRLFNMHLAEPSSGFISDEFVNALPSIEAERPRIEHPAYTGTVERIAPVIEALNHRMDPDDAIGIESFGDLGGEEQKTPTDHGYRLSGEQIEVLVRSICRRLQKTR